MNTKMTCQKDIEKKWFVIDAADQILGKVATKAATILRGKHKPTYTRHMDDGDNVIIINCAKIKVTGKKLTDKIYYTHSRYQGGIKGTTCGDLILKKPDYLLKNAVKGMLDGKSLGHSQLKNLKCYADATHNHEAQKPELLQI